MFLDFCSQLQPHYRRKSLQKIHNKICNKVQLILVFTLSGRWRRLPCYVSSHAFKRTEHIHIIGLFDLAKTFCEALSAFVNTYGKYDRSGWNKALPRAGEYCHYTRCMVPVVCYLALYVARRYLTCRHRVYVTISREPNAFPELFYAASP